MQILDRHHPDMKPLAARTTLRLGGLPLAEIRLDSLHDYDSLPALLEKEGFNVKILGGGSNLLVADEIDFAVIRPLHGCDGEAELLGPDPESDGPRMLIRVGAGQSMPALLSWCAAHGLSGLEGLVGIPCRLGGTIAMNAGAYGCSLSPLIKQLTVFTPEQGLHTLRPEGWHSAYRHFGLKEKSAWYINVEAVLSLALLPEKAIKKRMRDNFAQKKSTQPVTAHTAGCVFKNPEGHSAGRLLDACGMKGLRRGGLCFSEKHANFLVHEGGGSSRAALELIAEARQRVADATGIELEPEIKVWS